MVFVPGLDQQAARVVGQQVAGQPAIGTGSGRLRNALRRFLDELAFAVFLVGKLMDPAPSVTADLVPLSGNPAREIGGLLECSGRCREGAR